jgi:glycosyltransferase 2 family protein
LTSRLNSLLQYVLILGIAGLLLWLSLRGLQTGDDQNKADLLWQTWQQSNKFYLLLMAAIAVLSHWLRAVRWKMLMVPTGHTVQTWSSFHSIMIGYLVNLGIPRGGEISRSYNLFKLEKTPIETSFGTVVAERLVDLICMLILVALAFLTEWDHLMDFFGELGIGKSSQALVVPTWLWVVLALFLILGATLFMLRKNEKLLSVLSGFKNGLLAIGQLERKGLFIFYSIAIWLLYFLMTYSVMLAFEQTSGLGPGAVLILFAIGAIAMALPLPGGLGSYHTLMPLGLVMIYHIPKTDATAFVFVFHAWQTLVMIVGGVVSLICTYFILRMRKVNH